MANSKNKNNSALKNCAYCKRPFEPHCSTQIYCGSRCADLARAHNEFAERIAEIESRNSGEVNVAAADSAHACKVIPPARICEVCGQSFRPVFEGQTCCSTTCSSAAHEGMNIWNSSVCREEFQTLWRRMFELFGDDPDRPGLQESPRRILGMYLEVLEGQVYSNDEIAEMYNKCFDDESEVGGFDGMVTMRDIPIFSFCEHHAALMYNMKVNIGYIPKDRVIGLSKMARIADMVGKRLQLQEKIGNDIRYIMEKILGTPDVIVVIEGEHGCMTTRGIRKPGTTTVTSSLGGVFAKEPETRAEFYSKLKVGR